MGVEPQTGTGADQNGHSLDAADYLAAILPELAMIARKGGMDAVGKHIDQAADLARSILLKRAG